MVTSEQGDFCLLSHPGCSGWAGHHAPQKQKSSACDAQAVSPCPRITVLSSSIPSLPVRGRAELSPLPIGNLMEKRLEVWRGRFPCPSSLSGRFPLARRRVQLKPFLPQTAVRSFSSAHNTIEHCPPYATANHGGDVSSNTAVGGLMPVGSSS